MELVALLLHEIAKALQPHRTRNGSSNSWKRTACSRPVRSTSAKCWSWRS